MDFDKNEYASIVKHHYETNWGKKYNERKLQMGPMCDLSSDFSVLEYEPNEKRTMWTYATCGMSSINFRHPIELHIYSSKQDSSIVELLTAISYYHKTENKLDVNHTVNFGKSWQANSKCTYGLISLPYLDGPALELLKINKLIVHFYWLIPIALKELEYKKAKGIEALEKEFDSSQFNYLDPMRKSVI